jgi:hypothetical protein
MSFVGKVLVVLQLLLSICFMAFAGAVAAVQTNWKTETQKAKAALTQKDSEHRTLEAEYKKYQDDTALKLKDAENAANELKARNTALLGTVDTLKIENESLKTTATTKTEIASIAAEEAGTRRLESLTLRELYKKALEAKDAEFKAKAGLEDQKFRLETDLAKLKGDFTNLLRENGKYKDVLVAKGLPFEIKDYEKSAAPPPSVAGIVMETLKRPQGGELIEISMGSDDGLAKGHQVIVYRLGQNGQDSKYLGKIQIVHTDPDRAAGIVIDRAKNGIIQKGDNVKTQL